MQVSDIKKSSEWEKINQTSIKSNQTKSTKNFPKSIIWKDKPQSEFEMWYNTITDEIAYIFNSYMSLSHKQSEIASNMIEISYNLAQQWLDWNLKFLNTNRS